MMTIRNAVGHFVVAMGCVVALGAQAVEKTYTWSLPSDFAAEVSCADGFAIVQADGAMRGVGEVGAPDLPVYNFMVTIPKGGSLKGVTFEAEWDEVKVKGEGEQRILPSPVVVPVTAGEKVVFPEPGAQYEGVYPAEAAYAGEGMLSGNKTLQPIRITPFKWDGATKTLYAATKLEVKVVVVEKPTLKLTTSSVDTSEGEVLILSPHDFVSLWQGYAAFRKSTDAGKNFTFIVKDTKEIYDNPNLTDREKTDYALTLHHYIETNFYKSASCDKQYIILGASPAKTGTFNPNTMVPARYFFGDSGQSTHDYNQVGDVYYGCMDRLNAGKTDSSVEVWDVGNDGYYWATTNAYPYNFDANNSVDWTMEIAVTRVPLLERSVEILGAKTNEVTASDMMNSFTNRIAWAESAEFETADRGKAYVGGGENEGNCKGGTDERYTGERYFFDGITNMFDPSRSGVITSDEWGPRDRIYNIMGKVQPQRNAVIRACNISTVTMDQAYARSGDLATFYSHGDWREYGNLSASRAYQGGGFYSVYATSFSCMSGKYDCCDKTSFGITNALCFGEAPIAAHDPRQGALVTLTSARDGWSGGFGTLSMALDAYFLNALYGLADGTPMNAAQAGKYAHNAYAGSGAYGTKSAHGSVLGHAILCGDPLIKVFMMPDRTELTGYSQKLSVSTASTKMFDISTDVAASQAAFSDASGETLTLAGTGKFRTTSSLTVTNVGELVWNVAGGAGRNGIVFSGTRGNLTCEGTAERYFGPKLTNVGTISVPGGNVTLDFDTTACDFNKLAFVAATKDTANPNILRTRKEGFIPSTQTIPVVNSVLRLQTINIGGGNATLKSTPLFYVTNGVLKVENNPYWGTEYFVRPTYLSDATILGEYASFGLGRPDSDGYDLYVDGTSSLGGDTPIKVTGELRIHLEDAATTLTITNALANGHDNATGSVMLSGAGTVTIATPQTFTGDLTVGSGVKLILAVASAVTGNIVVQDGGKLELAATPLTSGVIALEDGSALYLPATPASGLYHVYDASKVTVTLDAGAKVYSVSAPTTEIAGRFNDGYYLPDSALIYWVSSSGYWQNSTSGKDPWRDASSAETYFVNGRSPVFGTVSGTTTPAVYVYTAVSPNYMEVNAPGSTYTFSSSSSYAITPTFLTLASSATFENPITDAVRVNVKGGTTTLGQYSKSTIKLLEVSDGGTLSMHAQGSLKGVGNRTVKALKFSFSEARTSTERVAIQELRLFQDTTFFPMPTGTVIEDCAGNKIRITGYTGDANKSHTYEWITGSDGNETLRALIDGVLGSGNKWWASQSTAPTWFTITFPTAQSPITGYNLRTADTAGRNPKAWSVYVLEDGSTFTKERSQSGVDFGSTGAWMDSGDGSAKAYDLMTDVRGMLHVKSGGTLISRGNAYVDVTLDEGAVLQLVGGNTSLFRPTAASYCNLNLPDDGGVYVSAKGLSASSGNEVLYGYSLTSDDLAKFTPADNVTLSLSGGNLYATIDDTKCGPFAATMTSASGATPTWSGLAWTDRYGASVTWNSSLKHSDSAATTITVESLASGGATLNLDVAATLGLIKLTGGSTETLTLSWSAAVVPTTIDLSEYAGKVILAPGSNLTSATEIIAGENTVLLAACTATLTIGANMKATVTDGAYGGTWTLASTGELCFGGAMPTTLPYTSGNPTGDGIIGYAGTFTTTADKLEFKNNLSLRRIEPGASITGNKIHFGNANNSVETFEQTGGIIEATYNGAGTDTSSSALIIAHWGYNNPSIITYNLLGGSMISTNSTLYGVYFGADGRATMTIGGGTDEAVLDTTGIAQGNQDRTQASALTIAENGILKLGVGGLYFRNDNAAVTLAGGTIYAKDDMSIQIDHASGLQMLGGTTSTLSAAAGKTLTVNAAFTGEGALNVAGAGTVKLTNTTGFPSTVMVASGATLTLPDGYKLEDGKIIQESDPNEMYHNTLSAGDENVKVARGTYGDIEVPSVGYYATSNAVLTTLGTSGTGIGGSYANIIVKSGNNNDTRQHTFLGWFCVPDLSAERILWFAYANGTASSNDNGYKVCVTTDGKIKIVKTSKGALDNGTALYSSGSIMMAGKWAHIAVAFTWGGSGNRTLTPTLFVNGVQTTLTGGTTIGSNLNGNTGAIVQIGAGVTAAGIYVDTTALSDAEKVASFATNEYYLTKGAEEMPEPEPTGTPRFTINFNVSQGSGGAYSSDMGVLTAAANTAIGEIPLGAWKQSTTYEYSGQVLSLGNVSYSNLASYDLVGKTNAATSVGLKVRCVQSTNISANNSWSSSYPILNANLSMKAGTITDEQSDGYLTFTGIPYDEYEVYVYFSRSTSQTDASTALFQALSVKTNDQTAVFYKGENGATVTATDKTVRWGDPTVTTELGEGTNYLHITGLHGAKLELYTEGEKYCGMAAVQIVGTYSDEPEPEQPETRTMMYFNRLGGEDYSVMVGAGTYGDKITVPDGGYCATHYATRTKLDNGASLPERGGSYTAIIGSGIDIYTHTVSGWFKVDALPTTAGNDNARDLYLARSTDGNHGGYKVAVDSTGAILVGKINYVGWNTESSSSVLKSSTTPVTGNTWFHLAVSVTSDRTSSVRQAVPRVFVNGTEVTMASGFFKTNLNGSNCSAFEIGGGVAAAGIYVDSAALVQEATFVGLATNATYVAVPPYIATIDGDTAWGNLEWTRAGVSATLPGDVSGCSLIIRGSGKVTGCTVSPASISIDEHVTFDASSIFTSETAFSGYGIFLVDASAIAADHTFGTSARWGIVGGATAATEVTVSAALTVNCSPFYSYGYVKLSNATFASSGISGLYSYDVRVVSGNLTLGKSTLSARSYDVTKDATITLDSEAELTISNSNMLQGSGRAGGFYGQGTFSVAPNRTVNGGYLGIATKYAYSGESVFRCQYIWADHGHVGANATLKFTVMDTTLNTYLIDMLTRFTVDNGGKIVLYKHGESTAFATFTSSANGTRFTTDQLFGTAAATRDFETEGSQTMGYQGLYTNAVRVANFGYDTGFISALVDAAHSEVTNAVPSEPYSVSLYADLGAFTATNIMTIGNAATKAIRLRVGAGLLQIVEVTGETIRETGIVAARGIGFHLFTVTKTDKGVALYVDGQLVGTDFAFTSTVSGPVTIGTGVSVRMFRIDEVLLSEALVANLAAMWPVNETTTPEVQSTTNILSQIRMNSEWAAQHLPESVVTNLYNHEAIKPDDEITGKTEEREQRLEEYQSELEKLGANGLPLWQSYLQGLDPDDTDKTHARPYVNEVRFEEDAVNYQATNTVVELSYANPARNSGINVTYHLAAKNAVGNVTRNVPVLGSKAMIVDDSQPMNFTPKCEVQPKKPNVIFILADDLGYGDVGWTIQNTRKANNQCYISTPHMDQMVAEGCELTAHYAAAPVCAPSRASILTGKHQGTCSLRDNSFDCPILEERTIGTVMREQGYVTHAIGKWGVGGGGESGLPMIAHPLDRGFDHFYGFLDHGAGHTYYHYDGLLNGAYMGIMEDRERKTETAVGLYSTDLLMARAKKVLIDQVAANKASGTEKPVFMYLAINMVHGSGADKLDASVPYKKSMHVPGRAFPDCTPDTDKKFGLNNGLDWDWLQANREPIADRNTYLYDYTKTSLFNDAKARYATTITRFDDAIEDLKQTIIDLGIDKNTIIVFTSDNGPTTEYDSNVNNFDSNGNFQGMKRSCMEGGLREPTFIWAPGYIKAGSVDNRPSMNHSWMQFFEEVAKSNTAPQMNNEVYSEYKYGGSQIMVRIGDYVGVNTAVTNSTLDTVELKIYDVVTDPGQNTNIASTAKGKELLPRMQALMKSYHTLWQRPGGFGNGDGAKESSGRPYDNK